jgi:methionine sulfoxide reductase heme-binding subunit
MSLTSSPVDWYAARAAGVVAYLLITGVVVLGIALAGRVRSQRWPRFAVEDVHRYGGTLVGIFLALHVTTIAIDSYTPFSVVDLVVPFAAGYRPFWTALGIVSAELLVAVALTNALRDRMPYSAWRRAHYLTFGVWGLASLHAVGAGTDRDSTWLSGLVLGGTLAVACALVVRLAKPPPAQRRPLTSRVSRSLGDVEPKS